MEKSPEWVIFDDKHPLKKARYWAAGGVLEIVQHDDEFDLGTGLDLGLNDDEDTIPSLYFNVPPWVAAPFLSNDHGAILAVILTAWKRDPSLQPISPRWEIAPVLSAILSHL